MARPVTRLALVVAAGAAWAAWRRLGRTTAPTGGWESAPFPFPPAPRPHSVRHVPANVDPGAGPETVPDELPPWTEPVGGTCPASHPVKAKLASGIYHEPGGGSYDRTRPERCYTDAAAAEADGLRAAKR